MKEKITLELDIEDVIQILLSLKYFKLICDNFNRDKLKNNTDKLIKKISEQTQ